MFPCRTIVLCLEQDVRASAHFHNECNSKGKTRIASEDVCLSVVRVSKTIVHPAAQWKTLQHLWSHATAHCPRYGLISFAKAGTATLFIVQGKLSGSEISPPQPQDIVMICYLSCVVDAISRMPRLITVDSPNHVYVLCMETWRGVVHYNFSVQERSFSLVKVIA